MPPLHERFLMVIAAERKEMRATSRRRFLIDGAKMAGGDALGLAFAGVPAGAGLRGS